MKVLAKRNKYTKRENCAPCNLKDKHNYMDHGVKVKVMESGKNFYPLKGFELGKVHTKHERRNRFRSKVTLKKVKCCRGNQILT